MKFLQQQPISSPTVAQSLWLRSGFKPIELPAAVEAAKNTLQQFQAMALVTTAHGVKLTASKAEQKFIRQAGGVAAAVLQKLGSNSLAKRRPPPEQLAGFINHVETRHQAGQPLLLRLGMGPVKNVQHFGAEQQPDLAEYLMLGQLTRIVGAVAALYPHGVKAQLVPDDQRGAEANQWPEAYGQRYIGGVQRLVGALGLSDWLTVESGQMRLYAQYRVPEFRAAAEEHFRRWERTDPVAYRAKLETATARARDNLATLAIAQRPVADAEIQASALRYLVAVKAEELSGIFAPRDAFPLRYGQHENSYQMFTMGQGQTKLPWQIALPVTLLPAGAEVPAALHPVAAGQRHPIPVLQS